MSAPPVRSFDLLHDSAILSVKVPSTDPTKPITVLRVSPVRTPSKVSVPQWQASTLGDRAVHQVLTYRDPVTGLSGQVGAISLLQRVSGCRVSEALLLRTSDVLLPDQIILRALKQSRPRVVRVPELAPLLNALVGPGDVALFSVSYAQVYRQYLNRGIVLHNGPGRRRTVTHTPRRNFIKSVHQVTKRLDTTRDVVGHKSRTSTLIYLKKGA